MKGTRSDILMKPNTVLSRETYSFVVDALLWSERVLCKRCDIAVDSKKLISGLVDLWWELFAGLVGLVYLVA